MEETTETIYIIRNNKIEKATLKIPAAQSIPITKEMIEHMWANFVEIGDEENPCTKN